MQSLIDAFRALVITPSSQLTASKQVSEGAKTDLINPLPDEILYDFFSRLDLATLAGCCLVSKKWSVLAGDSGLWKAVIYRELAFGKEKFAKYYGDIGEEPILRHDIRDVLKDTHHEMLEHRRRVAIRRGLSPEEVQEVRIPPIQKLFKLVVLPKTLDGKQFDAEMFEEYVKNPKNSIHKTCYAYFSPEAKEALRKALPQESSWALVPRDVLEGSGAQEWPEQQRLVVPLSGFEVIKGLAAIVGNFTEYVETGKCLYGQKPLTYTRCQEVVRIGQSDYQLVVGGFAPAGLDVCGGGFGHDSIGVAALRKL